MHLYNLLILRYEQFFDGVTYSESTEMNEARREIACLDNKLVKARGEWMADKKLLDIRWKDCTERYNKCYEDIPKFNGYYKVFNVKSLHKYANLCNNCM